MQLMLKKRYKISNKYKFRRIVWPNSTFFACSLCKYNKNKNKRWLAPCSICMLVIYTGATKFTSITKDFTYVFDKKV